MTSGDTSIVEEGFLTAQEWLVRMRAWGMTCRYDWSRYHTGA